MTRQIAMKYVVILLVGLFLLTNIIVVFFGNKEDDDFFNDEIHSNDNDEGSFDAQLEELLKETETEIEVDSGEVESSDKVFDDASLSEKKESNSPSSTYTLAMDDYGFHEEYEAFYLKKYGAKQMENFYLTASNVAALWFNQNKDMTMWKPYVTEDYFKYIDKLLRDSDKKVDEIVIHLTDPTLNVSENMDEIERVVIGAVGLKGNQQEMLEIVFDQVDNEFLVSAIAVTWSDLQ